MENTRDLIEEGLDAIAKVKDVLGAGLALLVEHDDNDRAATLISVSLDILESAEKQIDRAMPVA